MATREQVMDALLARIRTLCGSAFATYDRRFQMWDDLVNAIKAGNAPAFPALYLYDGVGLGGGIDNWDHSSQVSIAQPVKRLLTRTVVIYALKDGANTPDGANMNSVGASVLNPLIEAVEAAFEPDSTSFNVLTLGGLVRRCWIEGDGFLIPGDIDPAGLAMQTIPVKILLP